MLDALRFGLFIVSTSLGSVGVLAAWGFWRGAPTGTTALLMLGTASALTLVRGRI